MADVSTIYIRNLNERIPIKKLIAQLKELFEERGFHAIHVHASKTLKRKGQAYITLKDNRQAQLALEVFHMLEFNSRLMDVQLAKKDSDEARLLKDPSFDIDKVKAERKSKHTSSAKRPHESDDDNSRYEEQSYSKAKKPKVETISNVEPNKILLLTKLPKGASESDINALFQEHKGYSHCTYVSIRNLALIEFKSETDSANCLSKIGRSPVVSGTECNIEFAKK